MTHERTSINITMGELEKQFMLSRISRACSPASMAYYRRSNIKLNRFIGYTFAGKHANLYHEITEDFPMLSEEEQYELLGERLPLSVLESASFQADYIQWMRNGCKEQTVKSYLRGYRVLAYYAMEEELISPKKIIVGECESSIKNCYSDAEIVRLLAAPDKDNFIEYRNWVVINFLLSTGCRVSTLVDVNMVRQRVKSGIENARAKGKRLGRPATKPDDIPQIFYKHYPLFVQKKITLAGFAKLCSMSRTTIYKYIGLLAEAKP